MSDIEKFIKKLKTDRRFREKIIHIESIPSKLTSYRHTLNPIHPDIVEAIKKMKIGNLYSHQALAIDLIREKKNVQIVTPTASGKTLIYNIPVLEDIFLNYKTRALYLFPIKALEQDQLKSLRQFIELIKEKHPDFKTSAEIYDGDTSSYKRKQIKLSQPNVIITNPDMLHITILSFHSQWEEFFKNLKYVVIDELHTYKGIFGSHVSHIIRRLRRICEFYGSSPQFITCSATISNPKEHAERLTGLPYELISDSGAPSKGKYFIIVNTEDSPYREAMDLLIESINAGFKAIAFTKARKITELIYMWASRKAPHIADRISSYRAGYMPDERRDIEKGLFFNDLSGVVSTSALELGIDVGGLDVCILVGYPGSISSTWQRGGRVGRGDRESLIILIALQDALDQYYVRYPEEFFTKNFEAAIIDPMNKKIFQDHIVCASAEHPVKLCDASLYGIDEFNMLSILLSLTKKGRILQSASGIEWYSARRNPQRGINIRSMGESYTIIGEDGKPVGSIDGFRVFHEGHEGAIYLHHGRQYEVIKLDIQKRNVLVRQVDVDYFTNVMTEKETEILQCFESKDVNGFPVRIGRIKVTEWIKGYEKKRIQGQERLSLHLLDLPPIIFETVGLWIEIEDDIKEIVNENKWNFMGGIHAIEHTAISVFPIFALCDRNDIGGISYTFHTQVGKSAIFIYDGYPEGIGLSKRGYEVIRELLQKTLKIIEDCKCEDGCPCCIHSPKCGSGNKPLDKNAASFILQFILLKQREREIEKESLKIIPKEEKEILKKEHEIGLPKTLVFDLETQLSAEEVGGWENRHLMRLAIGVTYDIYREKFSVYKEEQAGELVNELLSSGLVIGFNIKRFDFAVLKRYTKEDLSRINSIDLLELIYNRLGFRLSLNHLALETLNVKKTADGLQSLIWFKNGKIDKIIEYCKSDVWITKKLYDFCRTNGYLIYRDYQGRSVRIPIEL